MSEIAQALAMEENIDWKGKSYKFGPMTLEVIAMWEMWLEDMAYEALSRRSSHSQAIAEIAKMSAAGAFDFFGAVSVERQQTLRGETKLYHLAISQHDKTFTEAMAKEMVEDRKAELHRKMTAMSRPPNVDAPGTTEPGANPIGDSLLPPSPQTVESPSPKSAA